MNKSESIVKIAAALVNAQKAIGSAKKGASNPFFHTKYADLGSVMEACKEALNANGICVLQPVGVDENGQYVQTILLHETGEFITERTRLSIKDADNPQSQGSAISYARRYGLQSMVFIPAEDDDAEAAKPTAAKRPYYDIQAQKVVTPEPSEAAQEPEFASPKQVQLIAILLKQKNQSDADLKKKYKVESKNELTKAQASLIIDNLLKLPSVEPEGAEAPTENGEEL